MPTPPAPDPKPWQPVLERPPLFNPFLNTTNPVEEIDEDPAADALTEEEMTAPMDAPLSPTTGAGTDNVDG